MKTLTNKTQLLLDGAKTGPLFFLETGNRVTFKTAVGLTAQTCGLSYKAAYTDKRREPDEDYRARLALWEGIQRDDSLTLKEAQELTFYIRLISLKKEFNR